MTFFPSYGAEQRGGTANCYVVISDEEIAAQLRSRGAPDEIARRLEKAVVDAGAGDNYSMICLEVRRR